MTTRTRLIDWLRALLPTDLQEAAEELGATLSLWVRPTPLEWHEELGCFLKREDLDVFSTHKSRGLGLQIALALREGARGFVISSSGNAAVAMGAWCEAFGAKGIAFLSDRTADGKIESVVATGVTTVVTPKPKNFSRYAARYGRLVDLRPSLDPRGPLGYGTLATEVVTQLGGAPSSLFLFVNSAVTLLGVWAGFQRLLEVGAIGFVPRLHAVQCTSSPALAQALHVEPTLEPLPVAGALGAQEPGDLARAAAAIARTGGRLWMLRNEAVEEEQQQLERQGLSMALESVAMMAGLRQARRELGTSALGARVVAVVAASERRPTSRNAERLQSVAVLDSYADVRRLLESLGFERDDVD